MLSSRSDTLDMSDKIYIGVDTSNYTTSLAALDGSGRVIASLRRLLPVGEGERGLRQSEALFVHTKQLPELWQQLRPHLVGRTVGGIGVSSRPRNIEGSYMPCFLAGVSAAPAAASSLGVSLEVVSHQCGHLMAALLSSGKTELADEPFTAYHVSGGTTELLAVRPSGDGAFCCEIVGGTRDISAGQLVDRVGVALGLSFPAGPALEKLAGEFSGRVRRRRPSVSDGYVNFSGIENLALSLYRETQDAAHTAAFVLTHIRDALCEIVASYFAEHGQTPLVCAGGVMSAKMLREEMERRFGAFTAEPSLSSDNAVGVAALAARRAREGRS
jgi:N6-L-threonylcarbamoyladenine synthase